MLNSNHVHSAGLSPLDEESPAVATDDTTPVLDSYLQACDAERFGTWSFHTHVRSVEWDPALFTRVLDQCASKLASTLKKASILTYACRNRAIPIPDGYVPVEGYLKMYGTDKVMRST